MSDGARLIDAQFEIVAECAAGSRRWIALLDLPPGLSSGQVRRWRLALASHVGALYAPYLRCARAEDRLAPLVTLPSCGAVAGIIARVEARIGPWGPPANEVVAGVARLDDSPLPAAGFLHEERVDAIRVTERGPTLLGARTTSLDPEWTHLAVRRLVHYLERQLALDARALVFHPNDRRLWHAIVQMVDRRIRPIFDAGALKGTSAEQAWFVQCDAALNDARSRDVGRVTARVGVAPAVPAEFVVFQLVLESSGRVAVEALRGA